MIKVVKSESFATLQDLGRQGLRSYGICHCGAMDSLSLRLGNILLGNDENACAIEVVLGGMVLRFQRTVSFCITGALYLASLDGKPIYSNWRYTAYKDQTLKLSRALKGMYGYLCVQGGIQVPLELSSRSTDLMTRIGGLQGRTLKDGDHLPLMDIGKPLSRIGVAPVSLSDVIHAIPSSEYEDFDKGSREIWWQDFWTLRSDSNRMGYRFKGRMLKRHRFVEMLSHAVQFGTVQVPPDGNPIVLMADAQTTGGYPKIASVVQSDLGRLAQVRFGSKVRFKQVNQEEAEVLNKKNELYLDQIRRIASETI